MNTTSNGAIKDTWVTAQLPDKTKVQASVRRVARDTVVFEFSSPGHSVLVSAVLDPFEVVFQESTVYSGSAVVRNLVDTRLAVTCEVAVNEECWKHIDGVSLTQQSISKMFGGFLQEWGKLYHVGPRYKTAVADLQTCLSELRLWADQLELRIQELDPSERTNAEASIISELNRHIVPTIDRLFDNFEEASDEINQDAVTAHRIYGRRQLHPFLLTSPFMYRTFRKPLGFAGDYEMINMIVRNRPTGATLFAKLADAYLLDQAPPNAVRNRVDFLESKIIAESVRLRTSGRAARIFDIACGPVCEIERFMRLHPLADRAEFTLLDFNEETLRYSENRLKECKKARGLVTPIEFVQKSVQSLLRTGGKRSPTVPQYDLIYCSGLYDYLSDSVCRALNDYLYDLLLPGGLLVVGNFAPSTPRQNLMEHLMEWFLIYRSSDELLGLAPLQAERQECQVYAEAAGANIFLEVRKPT